MSSNSVSSINKINKPLIIDAKSRIQKINLTVQATLRQAVDSLGWSDSEVAKYSGHPQSTIYRLLNAKTANPPFALVYDVCKTLGIGLPYGARLDTLIAPIDLYIGSSDFALNKNRKKDLEYIHVLPELSMLRIGKIKDDCAIQLYPVGSILFISDHPSRIQSLKFNDIAIVMVADDNGRKNSFIPMRVTNYSNSGHYKLISLTHNRKVQDYKVIDKTTLTWVQEKNKAQVIGVVQRALI